jgi:hypothetical protein
MRSRFQILGGLATLGLAVAGGYLVSKAWAEAA